MGDSEISREGVEVAGREGPHHQLLREGRTEEPRGKKEIMEGQRGHDPPVREGRCLKIQRRSVQRVGRCGDRKAGRGTGTELL